MITLFLGLVMRIGMDQSTQRAAINNQPRDKSPELCRREEIDFKHGHRMRTNGFVEESVDA